MNAEEYLKGLNEHDPVFEVDTDYEYTEQQLINFAERYHEMKLKLLRIGRVGQQRELLLDFVYWWDDELHPADANNLINKYEKHKYNI